MSMRSLDPSYGMGMEIARQRSRSPMPMPGMMGYQGQGDREDGNRYGVDRREEGVVEVEQMTMSLRAMHGSMCE